jgi:hypothetical protein
MRFKRMWVYKHFFSKQYGFGYSQGGRKHGQSKGREVRGRFRKKRLKQPQQVNRLTI